MTIRNPQGLTQTQHRIFVLGIAPIALDPPMLPAGPPILAGTPKHLTMFGGPITWAGPSREAIALPAAAHWCDWCSCETVPEPHSNDQIPWIKFPCHQQECRGCDAVLGADGDAYACDVCDYCEECCDCYVCAGGCGTRDTSPMCDACGMCCDCCSCYWCDAGHSVNLDQTPWCASCDYCEDHCVCEDMSSGIDPTWDTADMQHRGDAHAALQEATRLDPVQAMATFYLVEWVAYVASRAKRGSTYDAARRLIADCYRVQRGIVAACDWAFRVYVNIAIGGEIRHHYGVQRTAAMGALGRASAWDLWEGFTARVGRAAAARHALELFRDAGGWSAGYGGEAWATCADVLLAREEGRIDARTFVDRVFTLQHNGGSLLNKASWAIQTQGSEYVSRMQGLGDAHAATVTDVETLAYSAHYDARDLLGRALALETAWNPPAIGRTWSEEECERVQRERERAERALQYVESARHVAPSDCSVRPRQTTSEETLQAAWESRQMIAERVIQREREEYRASLQRERENL